MEGYGMYWFCLEAVARNVESHNLTFELEEDSELIAAATNIHHERVQEMMAYMCDLGLFENADGIVTCLKMASRTDEYTQKLLRSPKVVPTKIGYAPDKVPPIRTEQNRTEQKYMGANTPKRFTPPTVDQVQSYLDDKNYHFIDAEEFIAHYQARGWKAGKGLSVKCWKSCVTTWVKNHRKDSAADPVAEAIF